MASHVCDPSLVDCSLPPVPWEPTVGLVLVLLAAAVWGLLYIYNEGTK